MEAKEREQLLSLQASARRIFKGEDGEKILKFIEHMAGITDFVPSARLDCVEGVKRLNIVFNKMLSLRDKEWLAWYDTKGRNMYTV